MKIRLDKYQMEQLLALDEKIIYHYQQLYLTKDDEHRIKANAYIEIRKDLLDRGEVC